MNYFLSRGDTNIRSRYNIWPERHIDVVVEQDGQRILRSMLWGLIPSWWVKPQDRLNKTSHVRSDEVRYNKIFRDAFREGRCLIPMSGFFERIGMSGHKQPFYISAKQSPFLTAAGVWDEWVDPSTRKVITSVAMITTESNPFMLTYGERMPALLEPDDFEGWLHFEKGEEVLKAAKDDILQAWPVKPKGHNICDPEYDPTLIEPLTSEVAATPDTIGVR